jgi:hypothetical protein
MRYSLRTLPQFRLAGVMLAVFWLCVCFAAWGLPKHIGPTSLAGTIALAALKYITIPTAIGALFGFAWRGFVIGSVLFLGLLAWSFYALLTWGGT